MHIFLQFLFILFSFSNPFGFHSFLGAGIYFGLFLFVHIVLVSFQISEFSGVGCGFDFVSLATPLASSQRTSS